ncbi:PaaI family thioesterase [Albimonas sp. CAU 1670]|uniref:PaaI family thioesterase n=1 Tax=Albimonas sp. CAU 1670 TaxID=3032599 RepID=UPI0023D9FA79|nr:PaaI family thioesterase [Albimonas sp. CAU 1670]MDF2231371.1 PaaI family thioesterase [Albimonas sp. CAU 1670]
MTGPAPRNPDWRRHIEEVFASNAMMRHLEISLDEMSPGAVSVRAPITANVTQHHGYAHAGLAFTMGDNAQGMAAYSLIEPGQGIVTIEMKINLLAPAVGEALVARGFVERAGRRVIVTRAEVVALKDGTEKTVALMLGSMAVV